MKQPDKAETGELIHLLPNNRAKVRIPKGPSCRSCGMREAVCQPFGSEFMVIEAANSVRARPGQVVQIAFTAEKSPKRILCFSAILLAAILLGGLLGHKLALFGAHKLSSALLGLAFAALALVGLGSLARRSHGASPKKQPRISKIVN